MKIAQVNVYFKPFMVGGAEWYVYNISKQLVKMGHEVHVYTAKKYGGQEEKSEEIIDGIHVHRFPFKIDWTYRLKVWDGLKQSLSSGSFDIIHTYDYAQTHTSSALSVSKRLGIHSALTVFDIHSMIPRTWFKQVPMRIFERFFAKGILDSADSILVRAPTLVKPLTKLGIDNEKIIVTPSGINDESLGTFDGKAFLREHGINGSPVILFLGRLNPLKGPQHLISVAPTLIKKYPNIAFIFVGADQSGYADYLKELSRKLGVEKNVYLLGPIYEYVEKMKAYASCDVFALPTSYEGTSQAIFEAMSQARPIISTNTGGIPFQIEDGKEGILLPYGDNSQLLRSIERLVEDRDFASKLGNSAKEKVKAFRYSTLASELFRIYESTVKGKLRQTPEFESIPKPRR
ncbi:MAG TPA: glycosyltransferase family 4 protein [Nitrososphaerales archaeon]|nr:glycosyltransferase family 4 protein [Nitrososphaerales archaeon]